MTRTGEQFSIEAGDYRATIVEVGAGLREMWHGDRAVTAGYPADLLTPKCCGCVLVPWPNRIRDGQYSFAGVDYQLPLTEPSLHNASHGLARWARWSVARRAADRVRLEIDLVPQIGWPFELRCAIEYRLDAERGLIASATAQNHGVQAAPFGFGAHPYLSIGDVPLAEVELRIPAQSYLTLDAHKLPTGRLPVDGTSYDVRELTRLGPLRLDDCYVDLITNGGTGTAELRAAEHTTTLWWDESITAVQVYTPEVLHDTMTAVAIEPMSCPPDAFNSGDGLVVLAPGERWAASWGIRSGD
ncbi:MAG: aldose 1-epimerase family protein [Jatrophihabitans sp.]